MRYALLVTKFQSLDPRFLWHPNQCKSDLEGGKLLVVEMLRVVGPARDDEELHAVHRPSRFHALAAFAPFNNGCY